MILAQWVLTIIYVLWDVLVYTPPDNTP